MKHPVCQCNRRETIIADAYNASVLWAYDDEGNLPWSNEAEKLEYLCELFRCDEDAIFVACWLMAQYDEELEKYSVWKKLNPWWKRMFVRK